ncbi:MAG TPA: Rrf2 family transcriptional regulator [Candidatus Nanopelagicaceae bacterium]|nr:Rrf2 family transcriptional regulator [Candidatus Nanopelagicaceae bacterium]
MDMMLSKRADYVIRAALSLASVYESGEYRKIREIVLDTDLPRNFASQILARLVHSELVVSRAGKSGGYHLTRSPESITLLELVECGEGPLKPERCVLGDGPCRWDSVCPIHETWTNATTVLRATLEQTTLLTLSNGDSALAGGHHPIPLDTHRALTTNMTIDESASLKVEISEVVSRLERLEPRLGTLIKASYDAAELLRASIEPGGHSWSPRSVEVAARILSEDARSRSFDLTWMTNGLSEPTSRFEGRLEFRSVGANSTDIRLLGRFRPPSYIGHQAPSSLVEQLGGTIAKSTLRQLAMTLEMESRA